MQPIKTLVNVNYMEVSRQALQYAAKPNEFLWECYRQFERQAARQASGDGANMVMLWRSDLEAITPASRVQEVIAEAESIEDQAARLRGLNEVIGAFTNPSD
jgi:hypothetical protein